LARNPSEESRRLLAHALRPFILRRTKQQVARELPEKTEQTILCELEAAQRKQYDELRRHYRESLLLRVQSEGLAKSKMHDLKAGGLGLNLTAAEYVFLLDPWWNPAVEAQAVDRTHRIGQTRPVFAYRLIARDTVEEKVLELQKSKRDLADAILGEDNSLIRDLKREDIELLLS